MRVLHLGGSFGVLILWHSNQWHLLNFPATPQRDGLSLTAEDEVLGNLSEKQSVSLGSGEMPVVSTEGGNVSTVLVGHHLPLA